MQNKAVLDYMYTILCHKDEDTAKHSSRVAAIAHTIGKKMRLYDDDMELLDEASRLHDIGKIRVNTNILNKPGKLTEEEFSEIKKHTMYGYSIVSQQDSAVANVVLSHHERYYGNGYPNGISGTDIPLSARIIAVADSLDAMASDRCYRKALPWAVCAKEIDKNAGKMYDPDVVHAFNCCAEEIKSILTC